MPVRMAITKTTGQGEQFVVDVCQWNPVTGEVLHNVSELTELANNALSLADLRLLEMNTRMLEAYSLEKYCQPATWAKILSILEVMCGRVTVDTVARRWQSEIEETAELEAGRAAASPNTLATANNGDVYCQSCATTLSNQHILGGI